MSTRITPVESRSELKSFILFVRIQNEWKIATSRQNKRRRIYGKSIA